MKNISNSSLNKAELKGSNSKRIKSFFNIILLLIIALFIAQWLWVRSYTVSISDARIASHVTSISSNLSGWIIKAPTQRGIQVKKGDLLLKIDDRDSQLKLQTLAVKIAIKETEIKQAQTEQAMVADEYENHYLAQQAIVTSAQANNDESYSSLLQSKNDFERAKRLLNKKLISTAQWEQSQLALNKAQQHYKQSQAKLSKENFQLQQVFATGKSVNMLVMKVTILEQSLRALNIAREQQKLDIDNRQIRSPINGIVDKTFVNNGEFISPGRRILMLHDPNDIWIDANVMETNIHKIHIGMKAHIVIDAFPDQTFTAIVANIDHATTSEYALLPNPNPSGNFTKVTQRMRVKLVIKQQDNLLKPGMMVNVTIDTRN